MSEPKQTVQWIEFQGLAHWHRAMVVRLPTTGGGCRLAVVPTRETGAAAQREYAALLERLVH